jgi:hypothetical protein
MSVVALRVDVPSGDDSLRIAPSADAPIVENTSGAPQMEKPANNGVMPNDEPQQTALWIMNKKMSLLGDHSMNEDQPSPMIIWCICLKKLMT